MNGGRIIFAKEKRNPRKRKYKNKYVTVYDNWTFLDSMNLYPMALDTVGKIIGLEKGIIDHDRDENSDAELLKYCCRDCEITLKAVKFFRDIIYDKFKTHIRYTTAATSMAVFRANYLNETWYKMDGWKNDFFREGYYGGRVEVFKKGFIEKPIWHYDVNSLYPYAMKSDKFAHPNYLKYISGENIDIEKYLQYEGVAQCTVKTPEIHIPILPYRRESKLLFPTGIFNATWQLSELKYALENGYKIVSTDRVLYSSKSFNPFRDFINKLYAMRQDFKTTNNPAESIIKLVMNALYGKFGESHDNKIYGWEYEQDKFKFGDFYPVGEVKDNAASFGYFSTGNSEFTPHTFFNICGQVTATARVILHKLLTAADVHNIIYCDTDSIFSLSSLPDSMVNDSLGGLKLEGEYLSGTFLRPKWYAAGKNIKIKGVPRRTITDIKTTTFTYTKIAKSREALRRNLIAGSPLEIVKTLTLDDDKRIPVRPCDYFTNCTETKPVEIDIERIEYERQQKEISDSRNLHIDYGIPSDYYTDATLTRHEKKILKRDA